MAELTESSVESRMLEVEQASINSEAQARLAQIRSQLGLAAPAEQGQIASAPADATTPTQTPGTATTAGETPTTGA
jgi:hypothetical protein